MISYLCFSAQTARIALLFVWNDMPSYVYFFPALVKVHSSSNASVGVKKTCSRLGRFIVLSHFHMVSAIMSYSLRGDAVRYLPNHHSSPANFLRFSLHFWRFFGFRALQTTGVIYFRPYLRAGRLAVTLLARC